MTIRFFYELGVSRVVLPRELTIAEMKELISDCPFLSYEIIAFHQKCQFIDGMCGFYHAVTYPENIPTDFSYEKKEHDIPVIFTEDPTYEGHGCTIDWRCQSQEIVHRKQDDFSFPSCCACAIPELLDAGIDYFKIAGRGFPPFMIQRAITFLQKAYLLADSHKICKLYEETFSSPCRNKRCYYE